MTCKTSVEFRDLVGTLPQFPKQPRILHRDDRLRREILQQRDLLVAKRPHLLAVNRYCPEQRIILSQGDAHPCAGAAEVNKGPRATGSGISFLRLPIDDVDELLSSEKPVRRSAGPKRDHFCGLHELRERRWNIADGDISKVFAIIFEQCSENGVAYSRRFPQYGIEHRREVAGRGIDDLQNLCGGGLLGVSLIALDRPRS